MIKKIMSFCLALVICLTFCVPAFAKDAEAIQSDAYTLDADGNRLTFEMQEGTDGTYIMNYFVNGKLQTEAKNEMSILQSGNVVRVYAEFKTNQLDTGEVKVIYTL